MFYAGFICAFCEYKYSVSEKQVFSGPKGFDKPKGKKKLNRSNHLSFKEESDFCAHYIKSLAKVKKVNTER